MSHIATNIARAREGFGLSVDDAARRASLDVARWRELEAGSGPTTYELARVAQALTITPRRLLREDVGQVTRTTARFRAPEGAASWSTRDTMTLARAAEIARVGAWLLEILERPAPGLFAHRRVVPIDASQAAWRQGYALGEEARSAIAPTLSPIPSIAQCLQVLGVHVVSTALETEDVLAASIVDAESIPVIVLNTSASRVQRVLSRRAVLAHELCHLLHDGGEAELSMVSRLHEGERSLHEQRANAFAPAFLAPRTWLAVSAGMTSEACVKDIAEHWGLTFEGAAWHAKNAGLIEESVAKRLIAHPETVQPSASFEVSPRPRAPESIGLDCGVEPLVQGVVSELVLEAAERELISLGRAEEILAWR